MSPAARALLDAVVASGGRLHRRKATAVVREGLGVQRVRAQRFDPLLAEAGLTWDQREKYVVQKGHGTSPSLSVSVAPEEAANGAPGSVTEGPLARLIQSGFTVSQVDRMSDQSRESALALGLTATDTRVMPNGSLWTMGSPGGDVA